MSRHQDADHGREGHLRRVSADGLCTTARTRSNEVRTFCGVADVRLYCRPTWRPGELGAGRVAAEDQVGVPRPERGRPGSEQGVGDLPVPPGERPAVGSRPTGRGGWSAPPPACRTARAGAGWQSVGRVSRSFQPAPRPTSSQPPLISSTVATTLARLPGWQKVTGETSVPRRMVEVSGEPARVARASVVGLSGAPGKLE